MLKYLRIAVTALSLTGCVILVSLWVRSYWCDDCLDVCPGGPRMLRLYSREGVVVFAAWVFSNGTNPKADVTRYSTSKAQIEASHAKTGRPLIKWHPWKYSKHNYPGGATERDVFLPHWFLAVVVGSIGAVPWLNWQGRYSLRTLLIATTLVAVVLGIVVAAG